MNLPAAEQLGYVRHVVAPPRFLGSGTFEMYSNGGGDYDIEVDGQIYVGVEGFWITVSGQVRVINRTPGNPIEIFVRRCPCIYKVCND